MTKKKSFYSTQTIINSIQFNLEGLDCTQSSVTTLDQDSTVSTLVPTSNCYTIKLKVTNTVISKELLKEEDKE